MRVYPDPVDLGPCPGLVFDQGATSWVVLLPGAAYSAQAPLLWFARRAAMDAGRNVVAVVDTFDRDVDPVRWVEERVEAALAYVRDRDPQPVVIGKSLTSLAGSIAARDGLPAVWLTPMIAAGHELTAPAVAGLHAGSAPRLLIGGTADPSWDGAVARSFPSAEIVELEGADHGLEVADIATSAANLAAVADAIRRFLESLA
jgi:hypothetical protein